MDDYDDNEQINRIMSCVDGTIENILLSDNKLKQCIINNNFRKKLIKDDYNFRDSCIITLSLLIYMDNNII
jgi:hypothetical protein